MNDTKASNPLDCYHNHKQGAGNTKKATGADIKATLDLLQRQSFYRGQICHAADLPPRQADFGHLENPLSPVLEDCLKRRGLGHLYCHQTKAVDLARCGKNVMVATSSASGKSLCYNIAVMEAIIADTAGTAIYLFPTKALAQDQMGKLTSCFVPDILKNEHVATYDGDTPQAERAHIRRRARIILTNPDMLHVNILPSHHNWYRVIRNLKYVVVDEAHAYRGIFGSHVALVLRRLRRLARSYGSDPNFILTSATIQNAAEHARNLTGCDFEVVDNDGSPTGGRDFIFWNPPINDDVHSSRRSANIESADVTGFLIGQGVRCLCFTRTRRLAELVAGYVRNWLKKTNPALVERVKSYRAGYLPAERRKIEQGLFSGKLVGVVTTSAMELGVDIGDLGATVLAGYPGTIASAWQQAGRSGRRNARSLSFLIGLDNPLDQFLMNNPDFFFGHSFEHAMINAQNPYVRRAHLLCAAWELALSPDDERYFGTDLAGSLAELTAEGLLKERRGRYFLSPSLAFPAGDVGIRSASGESFCLINAENGTLVETIDSSHAFMQAHLGAVYLHQGESYVVNDFDLQNRTIRAQAQDVGYYTQVKDLTDLRVISVLRRQARGGVNIYLGEVEVKTEIVGYKRKAQLTDEVLSEEELELPARHFSTVALWFDLPEAATARINKEGLDWSGALHAAEHAEIGLLPLFAMCDRNDIGGLSTPLHPDTGRAQIFIYDAYPGGVGIAEKGFDLIGELWQATLNVIKGCLCREGCPSCIQSPKCGNNNKPLDKRAAAILLEMLLNGV